MEIEVKVPIRQLNDEIYPSEDVVVRSSAKAFVQIILPPGEVIVYGPSLREAIEKCER